MMRTMQVEGNTLRAWMNLYFTVLRGLAKTAKLILDRLGRLGRLLALRDMHFRSEVQLLLEPTTGK